MIRDEDRRRETLIQLGSEASDELLTAICDIVDVVACECPGYLTKILRQIRTFRAYTISCIDRFPEDKETHLWLNDQAAEVEKLLFQTLVELMRREELINSADQLVIDKLSQRVREIILKEEIFQQE